MKTRSFRSRWAPSPALVVSLIALFVALGGTSYAAINSLPKNSVGTAQIKNGAVTARKLKVAVLANYLKFGGTLPSGKTETGEWANGNYSGGGDSGGSSGFASATFPVPLAAGLDGSHVIYVSSGSATHCSSPGSADPGYLCVYQGYIYNALTPVSGDIRNPEAGAAVGTGIHGWAIFVGADLAGQLWYVGGSWAVTAP